MAFWIARGKRPDPQCEAAGADGGGGAARGARRERSWRRRRSGRHTRIETPYRRTSVFSTVSSWKL
jgi:hypothetical protein